MPRKPYEGTRVGPDGVRRREGPIREPDFENMETVETAEPRTGGERYFADRMKDPDYAEGYQESVEELNDERSAPLEGRQVEFETPKVHRHTSEPDVLVPDPAPDPVPAETVANDDSLPNRLEVPETVNSDKPDTTVTFPKHVGGPWYELSNGDRVRGKMSAEEEQRAVDLEAKLGT